MADALALAVVVALPWSISATLFFIVLWFLAALFALRPAAIYSEAITFAGGMPILLVALGVVGMTWANISWPERLGGADTFLKLLAIPLLLAQFRRSDRAAWLLFGFLGSCTALLILFWATTIRDLIALHGAAPPLSRVKNATTELGEFLICGFILLPLAIKALREKRRLWAAGMAALAVGFLGIVIYVLALPSRWFTILLELVVPPIALLLLFVWRQFNTKAMLGTLAGIVVACTVLYAASPAIQNRTVIEDLIGISRPVYWAKSVNFIAGAPILGHGTGSIFSLFARAATGHSGPMAEIVTNPFQETLSVGIQLGIIGIVALWAMWVSHLLLFRGKSPADWVGLVIVVYAIAASLSDSELFDAHRGWIYVFGVGIAGGAALRTRTAQHSAALDLDQHQSSLPH